MVCFERTELQQQHAVLYTAANAFFNPTREDNYPTVLLEASACGTTICTYDVGGCKEAFVAGCSNNDDGNVRFDQTVNVEIGSSSMGSINGKNSGSCLDIC